MEKESAGNKSLYLAYFEHIPPGVFDGIEKNKQMEDEDLDGRLRRCFGEDYILSQTALFAFGYEKGSARRPQPPTMHRGVVARLIQTDYPFLDGYGVCYGQIAVKGTGMSSNSWLFHNQHARDPDPLGLFGLAHARQEMEVSNLFASQGGRVGRVIANLAINHARFLQWYGSLGVSGKSFYDLEKELVKVEKNGDQAALCVRLMGTDRYRDYQESKEQPFGLYSHERIIIRAARLILYEMSKRGEQRFFDHYRLDTGLSLREHLKELTKGKINSQNITSLLFLNIHFKLRNLQVKERLSGERFAGQLKVEANDLNTDPAGFWYDFERSLPGPQYAAVEADINSIGYPLWAQFIAHSCIDRIFNTTKEAFSNGKSS